MKFSDDKQLDPKNFPSYEDYLEALKLKAEFEEKSKKINKVMKNSKTEEEIQEGMGKLGFSYFKDEYCDNHWYQKHQFCLMIALETLQENFNEAFFKNLLSEKDKIISKNMVSTGLEGNCELPPSWHNAKNLGHKAILFLIEIEDHLFQHKLSFKKLSRKQEIKNFCRNLFLFIQAFLYKKKIKAEWKQKIEAFLKNNQIFTKKISENLQNKFTQFT